MKKLPVLVLCLCAFFTSVCLAQNPARKCLEKKVATRQKKAPAIFRPFVYLFNKVTGKSEPMIRPMVNMGCLELSKTEIFANSSNNFQTVEITATPDPDRADPTNVPTFNYTVSGVKPGTFMITAAADDGCGVCGTTITMEVKVTE